MVRRIVRDAAYLVAILAFAWAVTWFVGYVVGHQ